MTKLERIESRLANIEALLERLCREELAAQAIDMGQRRAMLDGGIDALIELQRKRSKEASRVTRRSAKHG